MGCITQKGSTYTAKVRGTKTYRVELTAQPSGPPEIHCDYPYENGEACKHGIALGLALLDLLGPDESVQPPAPPRALVDQEPTSQQLL
ncbi:MAG: hypothetical protein EOO57_04155 [Hymenobacter sp.]|nr:MAG: hypothetical protein EOO57_04155 [Hymenobacter sp.]